MVEKHHTVRFPPQIFKEIDNYMSENKESLEKNHIKKMTDMMEEIWNHYKECKKINQLKHFNVYDDHVTIIDEKVPNKLVDVYNRNGKLICEWCKSENCEHIDFSYGIKEVQKAVKDGKIRKKPSS